MSYLVDRNIMIARISNGSLVVPMVQISNGSLGKINGIRGVSVSRTSVSSFSTVVTAEVPSVQMRRNLEKSSSGRG